MVKTVPNVAFVIGRIQLSFFGEVTDCLYTMSAALSLFIPVAALNPPDHGYKLGEHCDWFKHGAIYSSLLSGCCVFYALIIIGFPSTWHADNYEDSTRIPL